MVISDFESSALKKFNVLDVCYENADCSPIVLAGREGYEGAKDGEITNALKNLENLTDELNIIKSTLDNFRVLSGKEGRQR